MGMGSVVIAHKMKAERHFLVSDTLSSQLICICEFYLNKQIKVASEAIHFLIKHNKN